MKIWPGVLLIAVFAIGGVLWWQWQNPAAPQSMSMSPSNTLLQEKTSAVETLVPSLNVSEGGPALDEVSLPAFSQQAFDGHDFRVGRVLADNETYTRYYITYESGELTISGIMNVPKGEGPFPLLILNHGHIDTAIYTNGRGLKREQDYLARHGYVVIHPDYRNHADSDIESTTDQKFRLGYAEDVINAIAAVRAAQLPYVDGERIGMLGHSMGGGVAWRVAVTQPKLVDAFVQLAPVSADERDNFEKWIRNRPETAQAIVAAHGEPSINPEFWDAISPITFFEDIAAPIMIHHGTADESVPIAWSERAAAALAAAGKEVTFHVYPGEPHEFIDVWPGVMTRTVEFFDRHLGVE